MRRASLAETLVGALMAACVATTDSDFNRQRRAAQTAQAECNVRRSAEAQAAAEAKRARRNAKRLAALFPSQAGA